MSRTEIKIAYIGGGSRYWARDLMLDLAQSPHLSGAIDLYDHDHPAAEHNTRIGRGIFGRSDAITRFKVRAVRRLGDALKGADFVVISIEPGPTELRYADLEIPRAHGILQPVGDTTDPRRTRPERHLLGDSDVHSLVLNFGMKPREAARPQPKYQTKAGL